MIPSFIYVIEHGQMADDLDLGFGRSREVMGKRRSDSEDRKIAQEKIGRSAVDLQKIGRDLPKIGRDLPKIGRSRKRAQSASMTLTLTRLRQPNVL